MIQTSTNHPRHTQTAGSQVPHISNVKTCSSVSIISTSASGYSYAFGKTSSAALVSAAGACGDAVADGVGAICGGLDPGIAIVAASQVRAVVGGLKLLAVGLYLAVGAQCMTDSAGA